MRRSKASPMPIGNPRDFSMFAQHSVELTQHSCATKRHCLKTSNLSNLINLSNLALGFHGEFESLSRKRQQLTFSPHLLLKFLGNHSKGPNTFSKNIEKSPKGPRFAQGATFLGVSLSIELPTSNNQCAHR
jgi:hypothetical protein